MKRKNIEFLACWGVLDFRVFDLLLLEIRLMVRNQAVDLCIGRPTESLEVVPDIGFDLMLGVLNYGVSNSFELVCNPAVEIDCRGRDLC